MANDRDAHVVANGVATAPLHTVVCDWADVSELPDMAPFGAHNGPVATESSSRRSSRR